MSHLVLAASRLELVWRGSSNALLTHLSWHADLSLPDPSPELPDRSDFSSHFLRQHQDLSHGASSDEDFAELVWPGCTLAVLVLSCSPGLNFASLLQSLASSGLLKSSFKMLESLLRGLSSDFLKTYFIRRLWLVEVKKSSHRTCYQVLTCQ